jgi:hypothetical protein
VARAQLPAISKTNDPTGHERNNARGTTRSVPTTSTPPQNEGASDDIAAFVDRTTRSSEVPRFVEDAAVIATIVRLVRS